MNVKKVVSGIDGLMEALEEIKAGLQEEVGTLDVAPAETETPKKDTKKQKSSKKPKVEEPEVDTEESTENEDFSNMKYNDLKKLAVEHGMKSPNVPKAELIAFLSGESTDEAEDVEEEDIQNDSDEEDLTEQVTELLKDVETEDIADFLAENDISAKGKRPALIARIVSAIDDGDLSLDDITPEEDDEAEEEEPRPTGRGKVEKDESEDEDEDDESNDEDGEENELLDTVTKARQKACDKYMNTLDKILSNKSKKAKLVKELKEFFDVDDIEEDEIEDMAKDKFLLMTDDDGETHDEEDPYEINGVPCCCGQALTLVGDGYVCDVCATEYGEE